MSEKWKLYKGRVLPMGFCYREADGKTPIDLTGFEVRLVISDSLGGAELLNLSSAVATEIALNAAAGEFTAYVDGATPAILAVDVSGNPNGEFGEGHSGEYAPLDYEVILVSGAGVKEHFDGDTMLLFETVKPDL